MSRFIPQDILSDIQERADIHDVISGYIQLKKAGSRWKGLCPFHHEKTPSFFVNPEAQAFHCFGCGKGGNVFSFIMEKENVDFLEAAHILADKYNIDIPETENNIQNSDKTVDKKDRLYKLHDLTAELYHKNLGTDIGRKGIEYLHNRGITSEVINKFKLGFAPDLWDYLIKHSKVYNYTEQELIDSGLVVEKDNSTNIYDRFRNRITFPIWNERGKIIGFSARTIEENPQGGKYVNSPETLIFKKSRVLYALPFARKSFPEVKSAILCEGQLDVIAMHRAGFTNAVAPQGTAFTEEQAMLLKRYVNKIIICFDGDTAGINAAVKVIDILLPLNFEIQVVSLPIKQDPDTVLRQDGKEKLVEYIDTAKDFFEFLFSILSKEEKINTPHGKNNVIQRMLTTLRKIDNSVLRASYISILADKLSVPETAVMTELNKILRDKKNPERRAVKVKKVEKEQSKSEPINELVSKAEEELLELVILHGDIGRRLEEELPHEMISKTAVGRALDKAINLTINGEWENIKNELNMSLAENPDKSISRILTFPTVYSDNHDTSKAVSECINKIKKYFLESEINALMQKYKESKDIEKKKEILGEITKIQKEKLKLV